MLKTKILLFKHGHCTVFLTTVLQFILIYSLSFSKTTCQGCPQKTWFIIKLLLTLSENIIILKQGSNTTFECTGT